MKKTILMVLSVLITFSIGMSCVFAEEDSDNQIGYVKFHVDTSKDGFGQDTVVSLQTIKDGEVILRRFPLKDYGNEFSEFFETGVYILKVYDTTDSNWEFIYNDEPIVITGNINENINCNILIKRPDGYEEEKKPYTGDHELKENDDKNYDEKTLKSVNEEKKDEKNIFYFIGIACVIIALIIGIVIRYFKKRRKD